MRRWRATFFCIIIIAVLGSCAAKKPPTPEKTFEEAMSLYSLKNYEDSVDAFKRVKELFPDHKLAKAAQLMIGDANFNSEKYEEAVVAYDEFAKLYPEDINVPYARYMEAMSYYKRVSEKDRDQSFTRQAAEKFAFFLNQFPDTPYAVKSFEYYNECRKRLAEQEILVGNFYLRYDKLKAAEKRFKYALNNFPDVLVQEEALLGLYKVYKKQKDDKKAQMIIDTLLFYFPNSSYKTKLPR